MGLCVEEDEVQSRNGVFTCMAWHGQILKGLGTGKASRGLAEIVGHFGIVGFEVFGECDFWRANELHVAGTIDGDLHGQRIVGIQLLRRERGGDAECSHSTGKSCRLGR